ncbi:MAG: glycosyltransferase [Alphaproteobacteria bacterium]|nr:glycosyltransferase [Alphaproteobacteria bacterium]
MIAGSHDAPLRGIAAIAIGRNEGARLVACLNSLVSELTPSDVIYVDSGSSDGSVAAAQALGVHVVELDMTTPFTAARARNAGFDAVERLAGSPAYVQFIDGDCEVVEGWMSIAARFLGERPEIGIACGRRREKYPEASVYNLLCDIEWETSVGEARSCGGDFMIRTDTFREVGGFDPRLIAGEEPDLCFRLRSAGWKVWRLDAEMTRHDAAMTHASQWWRRMSRSGYAFANGARNHGRSPERFWVRETLRAVAFGAGLPLAAVVGAIAWTPAFLFVFAYYPVQMLRTYIRRADLRKGRAAYAIACTAARFPEMIGVLKFAWATLRRRQAALIEYK